MDLFDKFYVQTPKTRKNVSATTIYEYNVTGTDEFGNYVHGNIEVDNDEGGFGLIYSEESIDYADFGSISPKISAMENHVAQPYWFFIMYFVICCY